MQQAHGWKQRFIIATMASALCVALVGITAWGQEGPAKAAPAKDGPSLKPLAFEFRDTPWDKVLDWLADNSGGVPVISNVKPTGTFNFISPAGKKYTLPQIIDILNRSLLSQKIIIIRNTTNYTVIQSDEAQTIDTTILPNITIEDLDIDKPYDQQKYGQSELCQITFNLNGLTVDEAETNLGSRKGPFGRFQKIPKGNMLLATDTVGNLRQMKKLLDKIDPSNVDGGNIEVFPLRPAINGAAIETTIKGMFNLNPGQPPVANAPKIQYDEAQHKLLVTGDKPQIKQVREALTKLNAIKAAPVVEPGSTNQGNQASKGPGPAEDAIRVVKLNEGNASQYVDNLRYLLSSLRSNPVFVTYEPLMIQSIEDARKGVKPKDPVTGKDKELQLTDEKRPIPQISNKPGSPDKPVFIATLSRTNGVMIGSDDPEALDFAEQILAYLTKAGDEYYEVIPLKNANATIVRDTLDELINGKKQQGGGMGGPFAMMMGGGGGGGMRDVITGPVVRLAADKRTNSILVRAPRQIVVTIKRFIETELDVNNIDLKLQPKPRIVQLKHAFATDVVDVIKEIYREYLDTRGNGGGMAGMPMNPFMQQQQQSQPERSIKLAVTANKSDNSVILNCPDVLWDEVDNLITHLDKNNSDNEKEAKIINIGKADPQMLKNALDTITGKQGGTGANANANDPMAAMRNAMMNRFGGMGGLGGGGMGGGNFGGGGMGGGRQGGGGMGGGGRQGGGGGRPGGGGGGRGGNRYDTPPAILSDGTSSLKPGGSDFFEGRVKDDPRTQVTFDKNDDQNNNNNNNNIVQAQAQTPAPGQTQPTATGQSQPQAKDRPGTDAVQPQVGPQEKPKPKVPRGDVTYSVLPDGQVILIGDPEDIKLVEEILKKLIETSPTAETELKLFPLKHLDAGTLTLKLSEIFVRYNPVTRVLTAATGGPGGMGGGLGAPGGFGGAGAQQRPGGLGQGGFGQPGGFGQGGLGGGLGQGLGQATGAGASAPSVTPSQVGSILLVAISRQNSILVAGPKSAMEQVEKVIKMLDVPNSPNAQPVIVTLKRANATRVATTLNTFYQQRFQDTPGQNDVRITPDTRLNALIVFAGPEDVKEIQSLVEFFDKSETKVVNEVRIRTLKYSAAADLATTLQQALSQALFSANAPTTGTTGTGQQQGGFGGGFPNIFGGQGGGLFGNQGGLGGAAAQGQDRRGVNLSFNQRGGKPIETGLLEDVGIYADVRTNRLVLSAPAEAMTMLEKLIDELDVAPAILADVKVFRLKNSDATNALNTIQSIFTGQQRTGTGAGGIGAGGGFGAGLNQQQQMNFSTSAGQGPQPIIPRFSVDVRTNSLIVAAGRGDMMLAEVIINNLDSAVVRDRMFQVVRLKNNQAGNVATNLNSFFRNEITVLQLTELTGFLQTDREVTVIADATNNSIIVGASQRYFPEVMRLIDQLDIELAQVAIQVLIAQVRLDNTDEFGVEVGLQSPVLFDRSLFQPQPNTTNATTPIGQNGYNWNNVSTVNSSNQAVAGSTIVGMRGITNYGTGLSNPNTGIGGFVFSAASNSVNVLVRALRTQGRIEVLSRPQIVTRDNQQALISVGQQVPIVTGSTLSNGILQNTVEQQQVGIILKVLPQISPDGRIVMRVEPQISKVSQSTVDLGNGVKGTIIDQTIASTTIDATDGRTVIIGGLISKEDDKNQRGIPWLGDLPYVGALFRYRSQVKTKTELLIILTPHIIRNPMDAERVFMDESRKMSWSLDDVQALQGALPGASFLKQNCAENGLDHPINNPFNENYFAPNTTLPPVDEKLGTPKNQMPAPGVQMPAPGVQMPAPGVKMPAPGVPQQQPQTGPSWLQPPGATPPMYQSPQGYIAPQALPQQQLNGAWKTTVTYAPPQPGSNQPTIIQTQEMPIRQIQQAGSGSTGFAGGQQP